MRYKTSVLAEPCRPATKEQVGTHCLWCGRKLPSVKRHRVNLGRGTYGDGFFCGLRCGYMFGIIAAGTGMRLTTTSTENPVEKENSDG
jgi:hypothetical protein